MTPAEAADRRVSGWLFAASFLLYALFVHAHFNGSDEVGVYEQTRSLYERGALDVPPHSHAFPGRGGRLYSQFGIGQSLLALPLYGAGSLAERVLPRAWSRALAGPVLRTGPHRFGGELTIAALGLYAPLVSAALLVLFFRLGRRLGASLHGALLASALLGGTTYVATHAVYFLRHTSEACLVLGALLALLRFAETGRTRSLGLASAALAALPLLRVPAALFAPAVLGFGVHAWREARRRGVVPGAGSALLAVALPAAAAGALFAGVETAKWGSPFGTPFARQLAAFDNPLAVGLQGFLLSPGCSVFVYSPLLLAAPFAWRGLARSRPALLAAVLGVCLPALLVYAKFSAWTGLYSAPGPRYLFVATPLLLLPLGVWLDAGGRVGRRRRRAVALLGAAGVAVQIALLTASWGAVGEAMDYRSDAQKSFVFELRRSPVVASWRLLLTGGELDPAWLRLARGWPGQTPRPGAAALLATLGLAGSALTLLGLIRAAGSPATRGRAGSRSGPG